MLKKLSLKDIGTPISMKKGWVDFQIRRRKRGVINIIMVIKAPNKSVLVITDYPRMTNRKATKKKCKAIKAFIERNRQNGTSH